MVKKSDIKQENLFSVEEYDMVLKEWKGMPEFNQKDLTSWKSIIVHFERYEDLVEFSKAIGQKLTVNTRSIWFPQAEIGHMMNKRYRCEINYYEKRCQDCISLVNKSDKLICGKISKLIKEIKICPECEEL
jgi:hypothetical protein